MKRTPIKRLWHGLATGYSRALRQMTRQPAALAAAGAAVLAAALTACGGGSNPPFSYPLVNLVTSFGNAGVAQAENPRDLGTTLTQFEDSMLAVDQQGRIVVAGQRWQNERQGFFMRLLPNGQVDTNCGVNGWQIWGTGGPAIIRGVHILRDGRIAVAGRLPFTGIEVFKSDCTLDTSFGDKGIANFVEVWNVNPAPEPGTIVQDEVTGRIAVPVAGHVLMLTESGQRDTSFGVNGVATLNEANGNNFDSGAMAFLPDGKIVLGGLTDFGIVDGAYPGFMRLNADGSLDTTFGNHGDARRKIGTNNIAYPWGFARLPNGNLILTGLTQPSVGQSGLADTNAFYLMADANGQPTGFGGTGMMIWDAGPYPGRSSNYNTSLIVDSKGRIATCAYWLNNTRTDLGPFATEEDNLQFRDVATGELISSIGVDGTVKLPTNCKSMATTPDGNIVALGQSMVTINSASILVSKVQLP